MLKITQVELQKRSVNRSNKRFNIFLDGQFAFGADEDLVVEYRLIAGKVIDKPLLEKLLFEAEVGKLMELMYRLFNIRSRSEREVINYFRLKNGVLRVKGQEGISDLAVDLVVQKLKQKGLLNDLEFAKAWVEARRKTKKKGKIALRAELFQKGISRDIIEQVLEEEVNEEELAIQALEKKWKSWQNLPPVDFQSKALAYLMRRGFEYPLAKEVVEKLLKK